MKRIFSILAVSALFVFAGCNETFPETSNGYGKLCFNRFAISGGVEAELVTKSVDEAPGDYRIEIFDQAGETVFKGTYADVKATGYGIELRAGDYSVQVQSKDIPVAAFSDPVYGAYSVFSIKAGETTELEPVVCKIMQTAATVSYDQDLVDIMTGDGEATVEVTSGYPLSYKLNYNGGNIVYDNRIGYFAVEEEPCTMVVTFVGMVNGSKQKMTKLLSDVNVGDLRAITFIKKVDEEGNVSFDVKVVSYVQDEELYAESIVDKQEVIGDDPDAPKGDGGIKLEFAPGCTQFTDLENIIVPPSGTPMDLRLLATVPDGVKKFLVKIESTNAAFSSAVVAAGGPVLDLVNPKPESEIIFEVVPFPHGASILGQTSVAFNLSAAQEPIIAFEGTHTFTMQVTDKNSCHKDIIVKMIVK